MRIGLGVVLAPLAVFGLSLTTPLAVTGASSPLVSSQRVLAANDITYVGAFRMPSGTDTTFAYGNLSGRIVDGKVHLFVFGNNPKQHDPVYEIVDPGGGYSTNYTQAPRATLYANWGDIYHGRRTSWDSRGSQIILQYLHPVALFWNDDTQLLYWTYHDSYNVSGRPDWGLGASALTDATSDTSVAYGPWRVRVTDGDGVTHYGPWRCLYPFQDPSDRSMMCGSTIQSGNVGAPWGPDAYGGHVWPTTSTPGGVGAPDLNLPNRFLEYYFMGGSSSGDYIRSDGSVHGALRSFRRTNEQALWEPGGVPTLRANPALNHGVGSWSEHDGTNGAIWLELSNVRGVIFSSLLAGAVSQDPTDCVNAAHVWYSNAGLHPPVGACSHGCPPPVGITGPVTTNAFPAFIIYNPDDLLAVKAGTRKDYTVDPTSVIDLQQSYNVRTAGIGTMGAAKSLAGFYFDPVRKYLFTLSTQADDSPSRQFPQSLIHVFAIKDTPPGS